MMSTFAVSFIISMDFDSGDVGAGGFRICRYQLSLSMLRTLTYSIVTDDYYYIISVDI